MAHELTGGREFFIYSLIYSNKLAYFQLAAVLVYQNSLPKSHEEGYLNQQHVLVMSRTRLRVNSHSIVS